MTGYHTAPMIVDTDGDRGLRDIYFHESVTDLSDVAGPAWPEVLHRTALLLFTPDAVVSNQVGAGIEFLRRHGYTVAAHAPVRLHRHHIREIWRRDLSDPGWETRDRLAICDRLLTFTDSLAVLLVDESPEPDRPAARRLTALKGSGEPQQRTAGTLRASLDSPNNVFRLVHASDGPEQVLREIGILFAARRRRELFKALTHADRVPAAVLTADARQLARTAGPQSLNAEPSLRRLLDASPTANLHRHLADLAAGRPVHCWALYEAIDESGLDFIEWDVIAVGALALSSLPRPPEEA
ncbi:nucleoside-diphosphate kinase [Couchioplanes caeruleus]|uniref:Nucleoside diphosphate kinase-like domain-containing protein n=2 Tax=Couchioplanes caeruleus TaxID=56438 RepID=A0A1K0FJ15_9ACTN|nr:nucleoside-diphosphate kinase [Couchioplanes caeruleus]OJF12817.1 hypothetical protein BG844_18555 [Couchioplanes caeruleus subsp. caeruleus]ROP30666.1 nucleoside diphosphate kinase [Couchioplanes caeruleus]